MLMILGFGLWDSAVQGCVSRIMVGSMGIANLWWLLNMHVCNCAFHLICQPSVCSVLITCGLRKRQSRVQRTLLFSVLNGLKKLFIFSYWTDSHFSTIFWFRILSVTCLFLYQSSDVRSLSDSDAIPKKMKNLAI